MKTFSESIGNAFQYVLTITQTKELFQIISLILSIITTLVIMGTKLYNWYKKAKADGKITKDELGEAVDIISSGINDINELRRIEEEADEFVQIVEEQENAEKEVK